MSQMPLDDKTKNAHDSPCAIQFSVFFDNRVGRLMSLFDCFEGQSANIAAMSVVDSDDFGVVRIVSASSRDARKILNENKMSFSETHVMVVEMGEQFRFSRLCQILRGAELNIHYAYPCISRPNDLPTMVMHTDDDFFSTQILKAKGFGILCEEDLDGNLVE